MVQTFLQTAINNGRLFCQAITFDEAATKGECVAVIAISIDGTPGMVRVLRITATDDWDGELVPTDQVENGAEAYAWFMLGHDRMSVPLGSNMGRMIGAVVPEEGEAIQ